VISASGASKLATIGIGRTATQCKFHDLWTTGAALVVDDPAGIPERFTLVTPEGAGLKVSTARSVSTDREFSDSNLVSMFAPLPSQRYCNEFPELFPISAGGHNVLNWRCKF
jgi:hypothetical protein